MYQVDSEVILVSITQLLIPRIPLRAAKYFLHLVVILDLVKQPALDHPRDDPLEGADRSAAVGLVGVADEGLVSLVDLLAVGWLGFAEAVAGVVSCECTEEGEDSFALFEGREGDAAALRRTKPRAG